MSRFKLLRLLFGLEIVALALYFWHHTVSDFVGWGKNRLALHILILLAVLFLFALALLNLHRGAVKYLHMQTGLPIPDLSRSLLLSLSPVLLLYLIFLQHAVFLKDIRGYLLPTSLTGIVYLFFVFTSRLKSKHPQAVPSPKFLKNWNPGRLPLNRLSVLLFVLSLAVYIFLSSGLVFPPQPFTGDEPHYLLVTKSIIKDGDINLANNYENQDYLDFYPGKLRSHAYPGKKGNDYLYSKHFPALPVLLVPAYMIGETMSRLGAQKTENPQQKRAVIIFFSRLPLCFFTAILGLVFFLLVFDITQRKTLSISSWAIFVFTTPIVFFSQLIYPEIPVALLTLFTLRNLVFKKDSHTKRLFLAGIGIALLPWFGIKYTVISALLFAVSAAVLLKFKKIPGGWKKITFTLIPIMVSALLYLFYFWSLYGSFSPLSAYKGIPLDTPSSAGMSSMVRTDYVEIIKRAAGYFLDQRVGIFIYSPVFLLGIAGFFFLFKKKKKESLLLLAIFSTYTMFSAYYYWGGYCPPGRPLIPVLWILALLLAISLAENRTHVRSALIRVSTALSFLIVWVAMKNPWILYHEDISSDYYGQAIGSNLLHAISNTFIDFQKWVPSFVRGETQSPASLIFWTILMILIVVTYVTKNKKKEVRSISIKQGKQMVTVFCLSLVLLTYIFFDIRLEKKEIYEGQNYTLYFQDDNNFGKELEGFWTKGERQTSVILASDRPAEAIRMTVYGMSDGTTTIKVGPAEKKIFRKKRIGLEEKLFFPSPMGIRLGKEYLYTITISDNSGFYPYRLDKASKDNRYLGVFVKIAR
ncbi:MAG: hypothetical protein JSV17_11620 [Candidatus Aminicenantes bacterium]|nr:MAG: hypothetical protein JSV17_11620 [Candidatus Aminicenantes bacterium]